MHRHARRWFLKALSGAVASAALPEAAADSRSADLRAPRTPLDLDVRDIMAPGPSDLAGRFTLYTPKHLAPGERVPLLVLFHGQSETWHSEIGVHAWVERYGLGNAYARLRRPPIARTSLDKTLLLDAKVAELNASLAARPFRGLAIACPYTPDLRRLRFRAPALDAYTSWITDVVIPRARKEAPVFTDRARTTLDGNSLGAFVGLEIFSRRPDVFGAWGGIHCALDEPDLTRYADKVAAAFAGSNALPGTNVHIETSTRDPMAAINTALAKLLGERGVPNDFVVLPGDHDALFLREAGALEMLLWHDRRPR